MADATDDPATNPMLILAPLFLKGFRVETPEAVMSVSRLPDVDPRPRLAGDSDKIDPGKTDLRLATLHLRGCDGQSKPREVSMEACCMRWWGPRRRAGHGETRSSRPRVSQVSPIAFIHDPVQFDGLRAEEMGCHVAPGRVLTAGDAVVAHLTVPASLALGEVPRVM